MKKLIAISVMVMAIFGSISSAFAEIKWVDGYCTSSGQYRSGHYRDTSGDGYQYNNANYLGYNN